jgi:hypothetical protein
MASPPPATSAAEIRDRLEAAFQERTGLFYRSLRITPPYHSVEKARLALRGSLVNLPLPALQSLAEDENAIAALFKQTFIDSGLAKKHRGIITGLLAGNSERLPEECRALAEAYF